MTRVCLHKMDSDMALLVARWRLVAEFHMHGITWWLVSARNVEASAATNYREPPGLAKS